MKKLNRIYDRKSTISIPKLFLILAQGLVPLQKSLQIICWLSLDVVAGAVICNLMVFKLVKITSVPLVQVAILGATVWLIYILDHLWDAKKTVVQPADPRRIFFIDNYIIIKNFSVFLFTVIVAVAVAFLPLKIFLFGIGLSIFVTVYLLLVHYINKPQRYRWFQKEIIVGLLYGIGIWGSVGVITSNFHVVHWLISVIFTLIAIQNLLIFSLYEQEEDIHLKQQSIVKVFGEDMVRKTVLYLTFFIFFLGSSTLILFYTPLIRDWVVMEWVMTVILLIITIFPEYLKKSFAYRWIGDGVFMLPLILWFLNS